MAIQSMQLDPNAQAFTDDEIVGKVNTATVNITRASSVTAAARPIAAAEVGSTELAADAAAVNFNAGTTDITRASSVASAARPLDAGEVGSTELATDVAAVNFNAGTTDITRASSVDAAARPLGAGEVTNTELDANAAKANLDALTDTARGYIKTDATTGQFKVINIQRDSAGLLDVDYDDVAV